MISRKAGKPEVWEGLTPPYATLVVDPPWAYKNARGTQTRSRRGRSQVTAAGNYSTMTMQQIAALDAGELAAEHAHLYLWVTTPLLYSGVDLIAEAWGFRPVTTLTWVKTGAPGMGFSFRGHTEHVLFAVRGHLPIPPNKRESNVITSQRRGHSEKPQAFFDLVERVSPGPYCELFARAPRLGWDSWGYGYETVSA